MGFSEKELRQCVWVGGLTCGLGAVSFLLGWLLPLHEHSYWVSYTTAARGGGLLAVTFGALIVALALAHRHAHFFDLKRRASAEQFGISIGVICAVIIALSTFAVTKLPATPKDRLPREKKQAEDVLKGERRLKQMSVATIFVAGCVIAFYPTRRFFR